MKFVTAHTLKQMLSNKEDILLIDVREPHENAAFNIGGILIPMNQLMSRLPEIPANKPVVLYCQKGIRSVIAIQRLQQRGGYSNLLNLKGGLESWNEA